MKKIALLTVCLALGGCGGAPVTFAEDSGMGGDNTSTGGQDPSNTGGSFTTGSSSSIGGSDTSVGGALTSTGGSDNFTGGANSVGGTSGGFTGGTGGSATGGSATGGSGSTTDCEPGKSKCSGLDLEVCDALGHWSVSQTCPFVCYQDEANVQCIGSCSPSEKQCSAEGNAQVCDETGQWLHAQTCPNVCSAGECQGSCNPDSVQCAGTSAQLCNANGSWDTQETCPFVCSAGACTGSCKPGTIDCLGDVPRTCSAAGQWVAGNTCPFMCSAGQCAGSCDPGTKKCAGTGTQTCNTQGQWDAPVACTAGPHETASCSGAGLCGKSCANGFDDCTSAAGCESDLTAITTCGSCGTSCNPNPGHAAPTCTVSGCGFTCNAGWGDLNGSAVDGCEHNVSNDPENCGSIGHSCFGGSCSIGVCEFEGIELVATVSSWVSEIVYDAGYLYAYSGTQLLKIKADGSSQTILVSEVAISTQTNLIAENGFVYWVGTDGIYKVSSSGGAPIRLHTDTPNRIDVEGGYVYWTTGVLAPLDRCGSSFCPNQTSVYKVSTAGGDKTVVFSIGIGSMYSELNVVGNLLYVGVLPTSTLQRSSVYSVNLTTSQATQLITFEGRLWNFTEDNGSLYALGDATASGPTEFRKWVANSGDTLIRTGVPVVPADEAYFSMVVDAEKAYVNSLIGGLGAGIANVSASGMTYLSPAQNILDLTQDTSYLYWGTNVDFGKGYKILRKAK